MMKKVFNQKKKFLYLFVLVCLYNIYGKIFIQILLCLTMYAKKWRALLNYLIIVFFL